MRDIVSKIEVLSAKPRNETQTAQEILQSFSVCLGLDVSKIAVDFRQGVVRLSGVVPTGYLKEAAEELATWSPLVTTVVNELKVLDLPDVGDTSMPDLKRLVPNDWCRSKSAASHVCGSQSVPARRQR